MPPRAGRQYAVTRPHHLPGKVSATILLVTEDQTFGGACAQVLEEEGFAVMHARHSGHALLACLSGRPTDLLIAELSMEDGSGPALAERLKRHSPNLQSIYLAAAGRRAADPDVLVRPFTCADLLERVYDHLISSPRAS
jgi:DNA-binding response OmpR family regulator